MNGDKDRELSAASINGITIAAGSITDISACGRAHAASGTEGEISLFEGNDRIVTLYWSVPWGSKWNDFQARDRNSAYKVSVGPWNQNSGAIGTVKVEVEQAG